VEKMQTRVTYSMVEEGKREAERTRRQVESALLRADLISLGDVMRTLGKWR